jgi:tetratricopeptide (TPR) repeat protein
MMSEKHKRAAATIERAIAANDWLRARKLIREGLRKSRDDHWLLTRLSLTYFEQRQYRKSLQYVVQALQIAPYCPLAVWDYAGTLDMLGRKKRALQVFQWLISWGEKRIAYGECGEGIRFARSLIADCYYRIASIHEDRRERGKTLQAYRQHLLRRKRGVRSIYPLPEVRRRYAAAQAKSDPSQRTLRISAEGSRAQKTRAHAF